MSRRNYIPDDFTETLFENRNKRYGAYILRRLQSTFVIAGMVISIALLIVAFLAPDILAMLSGDLVQDQVLVERGAELPAGGPIPVSLPPPPKKQIAKTIPTKLTTDTSSENTEKPKQQDSSKLAGNGKDTLQGSGGSGSGNKDSNYRVVDILPEYPGGMQALHQFIQANLHYPQAEKQQQITGRVVISAVVSKDGTLEEITVVRGLTQNCDQEALRVIKMMPRFRPGYLHGEPVRTVIQIPIDFQFKQRI